VVLRHVFARREEGRDRAARYAAVHRGGGRAGPQGRVAEGLGGEVHAYVGGDRVNSAGGDDDRVRFCREVVVPNFAATEMEEEEG